MRTRWTNGGLLAASCLGLILAAPVASAQDRDEPRSERVTPEDRVIDGIVERLQRLAEQARERGQDERAARIERRIEEFLRGTDELRRLFRGDRRPDAEPRPERRSRERAPEPERAPDRFRGPERRSTEDGEEYYFGWDGENSGIEIAYAPAAREVRVRYFRETGRPLELRYPLEQGFAGLKDLWDQIQKWRSGEDAPRERNRDRERDQNPRRGGRTVDAPAR